MAGWLVMVMAERRIVEVDVSVILTNTPFVESEVAKFVVDRTGLKMDDTVGPLIELHFKDEDEQIKVTAEDDGKKGKLKINEDLVFLYVYGGNRHLTKNVFKRSLREYNIKSCEVFQRYRKPFNAFEWELSLNEDDYKIYVGREKPDASVYDGNPDMNIDVNNEVSVRILAPWEIDIVKTKIKLQFVELRGHPTPKNIKVK